MKLHTTLVAIVTVVFSLSTIAHCDEISDYKAIEAAVKAGKLTKEEGARKLAYLKKAAGSKSWNKPAPKSGSLSDYKAIEVAVKAGKLTKEEAAAKLSALKKYASTKSTKTTRPTDYQAIQKKLAELVDSGLLSEAQAKAMLAAAKKVGAARKSVEKNL